MHHTKSHLTKRLAAITLLLIASAALVACGGSSNTTSSTTTTNASATAPTGGAGRFSALRECLKKEGITLPSRSKGSKPKGGPGGGFLLGGGGARTLPSGVSRAKFEAAMKKCGGGGNFGGSRVRSRLGSASFKKSLEKFAACMRQDGVAVSAPNTSGKGPIFNTKGIDTTSAKFRAAEQKCASLLSFARPGAAGGGAGAPGAYGGPGGSAPYPAG